MLSFPTGNQVQVAIWGVWRTWSGEQVSCQQTLRQFILLCSLSRYLVASLEPRASTLTSQTKAAKTLGRSSRQSAQQFLRFFLMSLNTVSRKLWIIYIKRNFETNYQKGLITLDPQLSLTMNDYKNSAVFCTCGGQVNEALLYLSVRLC